MSDVTEFSLDTASLLAAESHGASIEAKSPWLLAWRRLRRNYVALFAGFVFVLMVAACLLAPVYRDYVAHTGPTATHLGGVTVRVHGKNVPIVSVTNGGIKIGPDGKIIQFHSDGVPIGPQFFAAGGRYFLGADVVGRDEAVRLLYGGITSLKVGVGSALICTFIAVVLALVSGYYGGWLDWAITRIFDIIWAFPVILLAIALGTALAISGFHHEIIPGVWTLNLPPGSLWLPTFVIAFPLIPYVARPLRGQILSLRQKEFIEAAIAQGASAPRIMFLEILPNVMSTVLVFFTLTIANNIIFEAGLSYLGAGVQPPNPSWGTLIADGADRIRTAPWLTMVPGLAICICVLALNIFGDGLRDALDPRSKVRIRG